MHVYRQIRNTFDGLYDEWPDRDVRHKMAVHHIDVQPVGAGLRGVRGAASQGAARTERVRKGISLSNRFSFVWGIGMFALLAVLARPIASIFCTVT